jgi:hypothetical protein
VTIPLVVIRPIPVNHRAPSGPAVMPFGKAPDPAANWVTKPFVVTRPIEPWHRQRARWRIVVWCYGRHWVDYYRRYKHSLADKREPRQPGRKSARRRAGRCDLVHRCGRIGFGCRRYRSAAMMIVAKAVVVLPTWTDRLGGNTSASRARAGRRAHSRLRPAPPTEA